MRVWKFLLGFLFWLFACYAVVNFMPNSFDKLMEGMAFGYHCDGCAHLALERLKTVTSASNKLVAEHPELFTDPENRWLNIDPDELVRRKYLQEIPGCMSMPQDLTIRCDYSRTLVDNQLPEIDVRCASHGSLAEFQGFMDKWNRISWIIALVSLLLFPVIPLIFLGYLIRSLRRFWREGKNNLQ